jgi:probable O-glycosylation ligase (exosortase A-associated)
MDSIDKHPIANDLRQIITLRHIGILALIVGCIFLGICLVLLPSKLQIALIMVFPAIAIVLFIFRNPYFGIYMFFLYEYLRPTDFIPALRPIRFGIVISISTLISWILYLIHSKKGIVWSNFNYLYIGFLAVIASTVITAANNRVALDTFQVMLTNFIIFLIATNVVDSARRLNLLIWLILLIHFYYAVRGIYNFSIVEFVRAGQRTSGVIGGSFIGDENDLAMTLAVMIPFAYFLLNKAQTWLKKISLSAMLVIFTLAIVACVSRGGMLGLAVVIMYIVAKSKKKIRSIIAISLLCVAVIMFAPSGYWSEAESITNLQDATAQSRFDYWKAAVRMVGDYPLTGIGAGNGPLRMPEYYEGPLDPGTRWGKAFHGTLPQVLAEVGIIGMILYLLMFYTAVVYLIRILREKRRIENDYRGLMAISILGGIFAYATTATFLSTAWYPQLWSLYLFIVIVYLDKERDAAQPILNNDI